MSNDIRPSVSVVIPTMDRPDLLRRAIRSALIQEYQGPLEVVVVYDGVASDPRLVDEFDRNTWTS